jgi:Domain of unknown function (DUF4436)
MGMTTDTSRSAPPHPRSAEPAESPEPSGRRSRIVLVITALVVLTATYAVMLVVFNSTGEMNQRSYTPGSSAGADRIVINASVLEVDPIRGAYQVRLAYRPEGALRSPDGSLTRAVNIEIDDIGSDPVETYDAGKRMPLHDLTLTASGDTSLYPFDSHDIPLEISVYDEARQPVPAALMFQASLHDWDVSSSLRQESRDGSILLDIKAHRSVSVIVFAIGLMCVLFMLVAVTVGMIARAVSLRKVGFPTLASLAALLFAVPGIRNSMPNTPPVGTLSDFMVFFWALLITTICMVVASVSWLRNADKERSD